MKRYHIIILQLLLLATGANAQRDLKYNLGKYAGQPSDFDIEYASYYALRSQPALVDWVSKDSTKAERNIVMANTGSMLNRDNYLHYQGNHTTFATAVAGGEMYVKEIGTLYGRASYSRQRQRNTYFNYADQPEDYMPYLVSDTVEQGTLKQERYLVDGGMSFRLGGMHYGVSGMYEGTSTAQETQPRHSVYNYWFRLSLSAAKITPHWLASIKVYPEINRQSLSISSALNAYTFAQFYGFGLMNLKESQAGYGYSRQQKIFGWGTDIQFALIPRDANGWKATMRVGYNHRSMETEESRYKNLFGTDSHLLTHQLTLTRRVSPVIDMYVVLDGYQQWRKGKERIYQQQMMNAEQNLYDFVEVGTNSLYELSRFQESLRAKTVWRMSAVSSASLMAGAFFDNYDEEYIQPILKVKTSTLTPQLALGYQYLTERNQIAADLGFSWRTNTSHNYDTMDETKTETAMTYLPFLLRSEDIWQTKASLVYAHTLKTDQSVGCRLTGSYLRRIRAPYESRLMFDVEHQHSQLWAGISLFCIF